MLKDFQNFKNIIISCAATIPFHSVSPIPPKKVCVLKKYKGEKQHLASPNNH